MNTISNPKTAKLNKTKKAAHILNLILKIIQVLLMLAAVGLSVVWVLTECNYFDLSTAASLSLGRTEVTLRDLSAGTASDGAAGSLILNPAALRASVYTGCLAVFAVMFTVWIGIDALRSPLKTMERGRPLTKWQLSRSLRTLGWISLAGGAVCEVLRIVTLTLQRRAIDISVIFNHQIVSGFSYTHPFHYQFLIAAGIFFLLSFISWYEAGLRRSD